MYIGMTTPVDILGEGMSSSMQLRYNERRMESAVLPLVGMVTISIIQTRKIERIK